MRFVLYDFAVSGSKRLLFFTFGELPATPRVRDTYFNICIVYAATGDLAGEVNTGSLEFANNNMCSHSQINGPSRDRGVANKLMLLPLKYRSSADLLQLLRKGMGLIRANYCFYRSIEEYQSERI